MSKSQLDALRDTICAKAGCWAVRCYTDAGVTADAGSSWRLLLTDHHFTSCAKPSGHGHCDLVAVRPQAGSEVVRLIEIKASPERGSNLQQKFDTTGRAVLAALEGDCDLHAELHVRPLPKVSTPYHFAPKINGRKIRVKLMANGKPV